MSVRIPLVQKYAPTGLSSIEGQASVVQYFKAVVKHPDESYKNYVITGSRGVGKTSIVRAFANDLIGCDASKTPNFLELDSYQVTDRQVLLSLKDYIFQEVPGHKVVLLDEWHLVDPNVQAGLLKDIETCTQPIFFFFVSTEREGILDTIFSRSIDFTLQRFSTAQLEDYLRRVVAAENLTVSEDALNTIVFRSSGHLRDLLNQLELAIVVGSEQYASQFSDLQMATQEFFTGSDKSVVDILMKFPYTLVQESLDHFIRERLIRERLVFKPPVVMQILSFYLKLKRYILNENDFYSFLLVFHDFVASQAKAHG